MGVVLVVPVNCPIHGRLETVDRDRVHLEILHSLEVLDDRLELVVPRNDSFRVDGRDRLEREQDSLLPQGAAYGFPAVLKVTDMGLVGRDRLLS